MKTSMGYGHQEIHLNKPLKSDYPISSVCGSQQFAHMHGDSCRLEGNIFI